MPFTPERARIASARSGNGSAQEGCPVVEVRRNFFDGTHNNLRLTTGALSGGNRDTWGEKSCPLINTYERAAILEVVPEISGLVGSVKR